MSRKPNARKVTPPDSVAPHSGLRALARLLARQAAVEWTTKPDEEKENDAENE